MSLDTLAHAVATAHISKIAFLPNVSTRVQDSIISNLIKAIRLGLQPYPAHDPQGELSKVASMLVRDLRGILPSYASIGNREAHSFLSTLIGAAQVKLRESEFELAMMQVVDFDPDTSMTGRLAAQLEQMVHALSADLSRGAAQGQKKVVRLLQRQGLEDWEALQVLDNLVDVLTINIPMTGAQFNSLLDSYLTKAVAAKVAGDYFQGKGK